MKILEQQSGIPLYRGMPFDEYFGNLKVGFFDIETTGLSPARSQLMLSGLLIPQDGAYVSRQILAESLSEEAAVLEQTLEDLCKLDAVVTYNGARFDIPFLERRARVCGIPFSPRSLPFDLDLYKVVRYHSDLRRFLPNLQQTTLENFLGLWDQRMDQISGKESVMLYHQWLVEREADLMKLILLHNSDDIHQLARLMKVLPKVNFHKAMTSLGFPWKNMALTKIRLTADSLSVSGTQRYAPINFICYGDGSLKFRFRESRQTFEIVAALHEKYSIVFADLPELGIDPRTLPHDPALDESLFVLENNGNVNYRAVNILARALLERTEQIWIMDK